jgi:nitrogen fixation protein FixH
MKTPRNFWPVGIFAVFIVFAAGMTTMVVLACRNTTDLVSRNYYEEELRFQGRIDSVERSKAFRAAAHYDATAKRITISLPAEHVGKDVSGNVQLYRPSASGLDQQIKLNPDAAGVQTIDAATLQNGLWKLRVVWTVAGQEYFFEQKIVIGSVAATSQVIRL